MLTLPHDVQPTDDNRSRLLQLEAAPAILTLIDSYLDDPVPANSLLSHFDVPTLTLLRAATGAILNLQLDHGQVRRYLRSNALALRTLYRLASSGRVYTPNAWALGHHGFGRAARGSPKEAENMERIRIGSTIATWSWRVLQDVLTNSEDGEREQGDDENVGYTADAQGRNATSNASSQALLTDVSVNTTAMALRAFLEACDSSFAPGDDVLPWSSSDVSSLIESDIEILSASAELIESSSLDLPAFRTQAVSPENWADLVRYPLGTGHRNPLQLYCAFLERAEPPPSWSGSSPAKLPAPDDEESVREASKQYGQCKAALARSIVAIAGEDRNMDTLFGGSAGAQKREAWFIDTLKAWVKLQQPDASGASAGRDDLVSVALLTLGNLARKDSHCVMMIEQHQLGDLLVPLLADQSIDVKVAHGLVGLLKNLAIPAQNKDVIGSLGAIECSGRFLDKSKDVVQPLQFGAVGLLKHLCSGSQANAARLASSAVLDELLALVQRTEDMPTKMEGSRVIFNAIKTLWSQRQSAGADASSIDAAKQRLTQPGAAQALAEMVRNGSKYPILVNEGVVGLTLLSTSSKGAILASEALLDQTLSTKQAQAEAESEDQATDADAELRNRKPRRKGTTDSLRSHASQPPPPPADSFGMIQRVLGRRDARMPPQYASNACSLLSAIMQATRDSGKTMDTGADGAASSPLNVVQLVAARAKEPLEWLTQNAPAEAAAAARQALELVRETTSP